MAEYPVVAAASFIILPYLTERALEKLMPKAYFK
jgi:hypothetical protein